MRRMKHLVLIAFLSFLLISVYGQTEKHFQSSYPAQSLLFLLESLEKDEGIRFFVDKDMAREIDMPAVQKADSYADFFSKVLEESGYAFYMEADQLYIFKGEALVTKLPEFEIYKSAVQSPENSSTGEAAGNEIYLETKRMSEENFITIGREKASEGSRLCVVSGQITSKENGEELIGATIYIKETSTGLITDVNGNFELKLYPGTYNIIVNHMAMKEAEYGLNVLSSGTFHITLENDLIELQEITVTDKRHSNVEGMMMGFDRISARTMKEIPVVMGEKDVIKIVQMLPGVQNAGEGSSGFNVRGGSADQNMFYINNISVYNTSHLFGFFTAFSPDVISDFSLYKNNVPSKYGGRIASIFEVTTRTGNKNNFYSQGGISPITAHLELEGPIVKDKVSIVASARSTYSDWILKRMNDHELRSSDASFFDGTLGVNADINSKNQLKTFFYRSSDSFSLSTRNNYNYANTGASVNLKHTFSSTLSADFSLASSIYGFSTIDKNNVSEAFEHSYSIRHTEARADFLLLSTSKHRLEFGLNSILYNLNRGDILPYGDESNRIPIYLGAERAVESSLYISDEFSLFPRLSLSLGMRYSLYTLIGPMDVGQYEEGQAKNKYTYTGSVTYDNGELVKLYSGPEPRAALNYRIGQNNSVKASYNRLRQYIFLLSNTIAIAPNDQWKLTDYHIAPPISDQLSLGYYHDLKDAGLNISVEVYKKWIQNIVEYKDGADFISNEPLETQVLQGAQDSRGIEFMIKKSGGQLTGWLSYAYSRSTVLINGMSAEERINGGVAYPSNFDKPHSLNLVSNFRVSRRLSFSTNVSYSTGRPVTLPVAAYYAEGTPYLLYSGRNAYRIPDYFRIDLSINLEGNLKFKKVAHSFWMLNIYNLTGRANAYSVFYEVDQGQIQGYQLSIFARPIVTLSWNYKFGNYYSE